VIRKRAREFLEAQGFVGLTDCEIAEFDGWLRFAPAVCLIWTAVGVVLASPAILALLVPFALIGGVWVRHPFDFVHEFGVRRITGGRPLPSYGRQRRFACLMASVMISITALLFYLEFTTVASVLGGVMIGMAAVNVTTGFCVPSFIYGLFFLGPQQKRRRPDREGREPSAGLNM
jgi:hypothetical protein